MKLIDAAKEKITDAFLYIEAIYSIAHFFSRLAKDNREKTRERT